MKIKELLKTVNVSWSPPDLHPILLAAGTAAQQLDASFNTSASIELYSLNVKQPGYDMELKTSVQSDHRFHKLIWGSYGNNPAGILVGGCDYGTIKIYSASKMIANESDCLLSSPDRHTGPVRTLDFNPFQSNLLASGSTESEIFIWDIVNTGTPMTPGSKSQPAEDVQYIQWNKQVQHILASTFSQRCVIWDLRKNEPIIKLTDANSKIRWKVLQWHPEIATQLCLASEDDQAPIIQLWDLRFATSPLKSFQHHQRGVLSLAWSPHDSDLMLSCAKDNTIVCWNPNADTPDQQLLCELAQTNQWNFDVSWCPKSPGLIVGSSFDGHATVYSLLGGQQEAPANSMNKLVDSFPGMDPFSQPPPKVERESAVALKKAPKWLKRPCGVSFGFGGKLISFEKESGESEGAPKKRVIVSQVIINPDMVQCSHTLENALKSEQFLDYCKSKVDNAANDYQKKIWNFVGAYFNDNVTQTFLDLLGYNIPILNDKLKQYIPLDDVHTITEGVSKLDSLQNGTAFDGSAAFDAIAQQEQKKKVSPKAVNINLKLNTSDDEDGLITQAILVGNIEAAVSLCFASKRYADAVILSMTGGPDLLAKTQYRYFSERTGALNSLINSLVSENWSELVNSCDINCWKEIIVGIFTHLNGSECSVLCDALGDRLAASEDPSLQKSAQICYICSGNLNKMIRVSETELQETVELVMIMKKALERQNIQVTIDGNISEILSQYAESLASEGELEAALNYIGNGQDARITSLRDRLHKALSYEQPSVQANIQKPSIKQTPQNYYDPTPKPQPNVYPQTTPVHAWNTNPLQNSYVMGGQATNSSATPTQVMQPTPQILQSMNTYPQQPMRNSQAPPPPIQTTGSSLGGSRPPSVGPQTRPKYMIDPSVKSGPTYSYSQQQIYNPQSQGFSSQNTYQPQPPTFGSYQNPSVQNPIPGPLEHDEYKPLQPNIMTPSFPANPPPTNVYDPAAMQSGIQQSQGFSNEVPIYQPTSQSSGWNDPPIAKSLRAQPSVDYQQPTPILHPLRGVSQNYNTPPEENYHQDMMNYNHPQYANNIMNSENQYNKPLSQIKSMQPAASIEVAKEVQPEKPKVPIPDQYKHLQTIFDELKIQCYESSKNPQMKRKIEDVARKLEFLYDCLRENSLSQNTLQGLDQISQMIQAGNYTNGLAVHTQLVSGPDFSQIASFMPGIKVLLQSALQLGVYIT
ncbi:protein transport protein Sec31A [Chelonus insularis]|uniref:protein transport protein Sec31A n=1 Tax=Chelonus insularis TaxID=460826 RepID=UPI00158C33F2|nr:protein transport protein Sec31A [Chelonus insularis]